MKLNAGNQDFWGMLWREKKIENLVTTGKLDSKTARGWQRKYLDG